MLITALVTSLILRASRADIFLVMSEDDTSSKPGRTRGKQGQRRDNRS